MDLVMFCDAVDGVDWPGREVHMIGIWIAINTVAVGLAGLRGIQSDRRERDFWHAYDDRRASKDLTARPWAGEEGS